MSKCNDIRFFVSRRNAYVEKIKATLNDSQREGTFVGIAPALGTHAFLLRLASCIHFFFKARWLYSVLDDTNASSICCMPLIAQLQKSYPASSESQHSLHYPEKCQTQSGEQNKAFA